MSKSEAALLAKINDFAERLNYGPGPADHFTASMRDAAVDVTLASGLHHKTAALIPVILAAEAAEEVAKGVVRDTRALLLDVLNQTTGVIRSASHQAGVANGKASVIITDEALLSPTMLRTAPDKAAIERALRAGGSVPGAVLSNGGGPQLRITTIKGTTA